MGLARSSSIYWRSVSRRMDELEDPGSVAWLRRRVLGWSQWPVGRSVHDEKLNFTIIYNFAIVSQILETHWYFLLE